MSSLFDNPDDALSGSQERLGELDKISQRFGKSLTGAFASGIAQGKQFEDILRNVGQKFISIGLQSAMKPLAQGVGGMFSNMFSGLFGGGGEGGGFGNAPMSITPFADGGVIGTPSYFPMGQGLGLMGEAGAEAIMPLSRGPDGKLGVASRGGGGGASITVNIAAQDVDSFARSEQAISSALARAVARGNRSL